MQRRNDSKVVKAYELAEKVERSATQLNVSRSREREPLQWHEQIMRRRDEEPLLAESPVLEKPAPDSALQTQATPTAAEGAPLGAARPRARSR